MKTGKLTTEEVHEALDRWVQKTVMALYTTYGQPETEDDRRRLRAVTVRLVDTMRRRAGVKGEELTWEKLREMESHFDAILEEEKQVFNV